MQLQKNKLIRELGITLLGSILFAAILQPLMGFLWKLLKSSSFSLYNSYANYLIRRASVGSVDYTDILVAIIIAGGFLLFALTLITKANKTIRRGNEMQAEAQSALAKIHTPIKPADEK